MKEGVRGGVGVDVRVLERVRVEAGLREREGSGVTLGDLGPALQDMDGLADGVAVLLADAPPALVAVSDPEGVGMGVWEPMVGVARRTVRTAADAAPAPQHSVVSTRPKVDEISV